MTVLEFGMTGENRHVKIPPDWAGFLSGRRLRAIAHSVRNGRVYLTGFYSERVLVSTTRYSLTVRVWSSPMAFAAVRS